MAAKINHFSLQTNNSEDFIWFFSQNGRNIAIFIKKNSLQRNEQIQNMFVIPFVLSNLQNKRHIKIQSLPAYQFNFGCGNIEF